MPISQQIHATLRPGELIPVHCSFRVLTLSQSSPSLSFARPAVSSLTPQPVDEPFEANDNPAPSRLQRQQQQPLLSPPQSQSRPSSSTGSNRTLRRTPNLQPWRVTSNRLPVAQTPQSRGSQRLAAFAPTPSDSLPSSASPQATAQIPRSSSYWPKRSTQTSKHTAEAILYALEAIRGDPEGRLGSPEASSSESQPQQWRPRQFAPNVAEENASMADLMSAANGRSQNGGGLGPVPVPQVPGGDTGRATPPTEIMARRRAREAKRREERDRQQREQNEAQLRALEQQHVEPDNRVAVAVGVVGDRTSQRRSVTRQSIADQPTATERGPGDRGSGGSNRGVNPSAIRRSGERGERISGEPQDPNVTAAQTRTQPRREILPTGQSKPVESTRSSQRATSGPPLGSLENQASQIRQPSRTTRPAQTRAGQPGTAAAVQPPPPQEPTSRSNTSSFPHAFERWEQLSSHWEGLTSFWIRRIEQNKEDLERDPLNQQMARQVNDLSAAGANLFHAVVELQRLRASSERKFQRWFFETRADQERARETQARLEEQLRTEREARTQTATRDARYEKEMKDAYTAKNTADSQVKEMRRELAISKDEARRAWEELGRREQEERERTMSLKSGQTTIVGGVQVVPMSSNQRQPQVRSSTREGQVPSMTAPVEDVSNDPMYTTYDPARSDTDTDPFTEAGRGNYELPPRAHPSSQAAYQTSNTSSAEVQAARTAGVPDPSGGVRTTTTTTTTTGPSTYLRYGPDGAIPPSGQASAFYQHEGSSLHPDDQAGVGLEGDERSYVQSVSPSLSQEDYEMDSNGEVRRDPSGHPIILRRPLGSEDSDEFNVTEQLEREQILGRSYGSNMSGVEYGTGPTPSAGGNGGQPVDYEGSGYGSGWEAMPRHHHPTRLSDVLEEDERSRTSPSRASQTSRGFR